MTDRTWHPPEDRKPLTRKQIADLFLRQDGKCPECGQKLQMKGHRVVGVDEHVNPLWRGGSNDLENRELWCQPCTKPKTAQEATERAKGLRVRDKAIGAFKRSGKPMAGSRASGWRRKMDGSVVRREE
jgi:5-methylcytosine-specific restriction enzyme A